MIKPMHFEDKTYISLSTGINTKCIQLLKSIIRLIEMKYRLQVAEAELEIFLTDNGLIYLSGCDKFNFYDSTGDINT